MVWEQQARAAHVNTPCSGTQGWGGTLPAGLLRSAVWLLAGLPLRGRLAAGGASWPLLLRVLDVAGAGPLTSGSASTPSLCEPCPTAAAALQA